MFVSGVTDARPTVHDSVAPVIPDPGDAPPGHDVPPVTGTAWNGDGGVRTPAGRDPLTVVVSDDPYVRALQGKSFFERNPGAWRLTNVMSHLGNGSQMLFGADNPLGDALAAVTMTRYGVGQYFVDQVRWQIRTERQPRDPWWMHMNKRSLEDPLLAEAYVRAGRQDELVSPTLREWAAYVERNDAHKRVLGIPVAQGYLGAATINPEGSIPRDHLADSPRAERLPLLTRLRLAKEFHDTRKVYWTAHNDSIQGARQVFMPLLEESKRVHPYEGYIQDSWSRFINVLPRFVPPGAGAGAHMVQKAILAQNYPATRDDASLTQRAFARFGYLFGDH